MTIKVIEAQYRELIEQWPDRPRILAEGDSWFSHLLANNLIRVIDEHYAFHILNLATAGDEARHIFGQDQLPRLEAAMRSDQGFELDLVLISAGGNDLLAHLSRVLRPIGANDPWQASIDTQSLDQVLQLVSDAYQRLFDAKQRANPDLPLVFHGYDTPYPTGTPAQLFFPASLVFSFGPWMRPALRAANIPEADHRAAVEALVGRLQSALQALEDTGAGNHYVDLGGAIDSVAGWSDELHPNEGGYREVLERYRPVLDPL